MNANRLLFIPWEPLPVIDRYLFRVVLQGLTVVGGILLAVILVNTLARNLSEATKGDLPAGEVFNMLLLQSVNYTVLLLPFALYLGIMLGLGRLYRDSEMVALSACGVGLRRLYRSMMYFVLPTVVVLGGLSLFIAPWAAQQAYIVVDEAERNADILAIQPGRFNESKSGRRTVFVGSVSPLNGEWRDIFVEDRGGERPQVFRAEAGFTEVERESGDRFLVLQNGYRYEGLPGAADYRILKFSRYAVRIKEGDANRAQQKLDARPTPQLLAGGSAPEIAELQWRISVPLSALLLALLAIPLSHTPPRSNRHGQLVSAILIYITYANLMNVAKVWVAKGAIAPWLGLWWVHLLLLLALSILIVRRRGWRWLRGEWGRAR